MVVTLLFGGAWFNRNKDYNFNDRETSWSGSQEHKRSDDLNITIGGRQRPSSSSSSSERPDSPTDDWSSSSTSMLGAHTQPTLRRRKLQLFGYERLVTTPNTAIFKDRFLSRVLQKFPFLVEAWYWALLYWVCRGLFYPQLSIHMGLGMEASKSYGITNTLH